MKNAIEKSKLYEAAKSKVETASSSLKPAVDLTMDAKNKITKEDLRLLIIQAEQALEQTVDKTKEAISSVKDSYDAGTLKEDSKALLKDKKEIAEEKIKDLRSKAKETRRIRRRT